MPDNDYIARGEPDQAPPRQAMAERREQLPVDQPHHAIGNPLDATPAQFRQALTDRKTNYDALKELLRELLVPGKDFGPIHVVSKDKCDKGIYCDNPRHFSGNQLFDPGADKIRNFLGLSAHYPGEDDYRKAALRGIVLEDIIVKCVLLDASRRMVSEGQGAARVSQMKGDLSNTLKRAAKRARVEAVQRLPGVSSLFEDGFFDQLAAGKNTMMDRQSRVDRGPTSTQWQTGAELTACPIGKDHKGKPWSEVPDGFLQWILDKVQDKPDIVNAARREVDRRAMSEAEADAPLSDVELDQVFGKPATAASADPFNLPADDFDDYQWFEPPPADDRHAKPMHNHRPTTRGNRR